MIPMCWKCSDVELKKFIMCGATVFHMVGCKSCDAKSYEEARIMCPLISEDAREELMYEHKESTLNDS
jgi:hypothetical protein